MAKSPFNPAYCRPGLVPGLVPGLPFFPIVQGVTGKQAGLPGLPGIFRLLGFFRGEEFSSDLLKDPAYRLIAIYIIYKYLIYIDKVLTGWRAAYQAGLRGPAWSSRGDLLGSGGWGARVIAHIGRIKKPVQICSIWYIEALSKSDSHSCEIKTRDKTQASEKPQISGLFSGRLGTCPGETTGNAAAVVPFPSGPGAPAAAPHKTTVRRGFSSPHGGTVQAGALACGPARAPRHLPRITPDRARASLGSRLLTREGNE